MVELPQFTREGSLPTSGGGARVNPGGFGVDAGAVRQLTEQTSQGIADFAAARKAAQQAADLADFNLNASRLVGQAKLAAEQDPDFQNAPARFDKTVADGVKGFLAGIKDPAVKAQALRNATGLTDRAAIVVQRKAHERFVGTRRADLDQRIADYAQQIGSSAEAEERLLLQGLAEEEINGMVASGVITPEEAGDQRRRLLSDVDEVTASQIIRANPEAAVEFLQDQGNLVNLEPKERETLINRAISLQEAARKEAARLSDKRDRDDEKSQDDLSDQLFKQMLTLHAEGRLTRAGVQQFQGIMKPGQFQTGLNLTDPRQQRSNDPGTLQELLPRVGDPEFFNDAVAAHGQGNLEDGMLLQLLGSNDRIRNAAKPDNPFKRARDFVKTSLDPGILTGSGRAVLLRTQANGLAEIDAFRDQNPNVGIVDLQREAERIVDSFEVVKFDEIRQTLGTPMFHAGGQETVTIESLFVSESAAVAAFDRGEISAHQRDRELKRIRDWRIILGTGGKNRGRGSGGQSSSARSPGQSGGGGAAGLLPPGAATE